MGRNMRRNMSRSKKSSSHHGHLGLLLLDNRSLLDVLSVLIDVATVDGADAGAGGAAGAALLGVVAGEKYCEQLKTIVM